MPMNEAGGYRRSNLTQQQQREAEAAIYGLAPQQQMSIDLSQLTPDQIEQLRAMLNQSQQKAGQVNSFDLNNPPVAPYSYQPFPKMIYHHESGKHKIVRNQAQLNEHLDTGWSTRQQPDAEAPASEPDLDDATLAEAAEIDSRLDKKSKRK